jgi:hypothetical protein
MEDEKFGTLKNDVQEIIDLMKIKEYKTANNKLADASEALDELLDFLEEDNDLIQISKYQVSLNQLQMKINVALENLEAPQLLVFIIGLLYPQNSQKQ